MYLPHFIKVNRTLLKKKPFFFNSVSIKVAIDSVISVYLSEKQGNYQKKNGFL